jgi:hypothetical protein
MVGYQKNTKIMNTILKDDKKLEVETKSQMGATQGTENNEMLFHRKANLDSLIENMTNLREIINFIFLLSQKYFNHNNIYENADCAVQEMIKAFEHIKETFNCINELDTSSVNEKDKK